MRKLLFVVLLIAACLAGLYVASPYLTVYRLVQAARAGDGRTVAAYVDFPAVRRGLKPQLQTYLEADLERERGQPHSIWDQLKFAVTPYIAGPATELLITPETVAAMIRTGRAPRVASAAGHISASSAADTGPGDSRPLHLGYVGDDLDQFHVDVASRSRPTARVKLRLLRRGFLAWRVVSLDLPPPPGPEGPAAAG